MWWDRAEAGAGGHYTRRVKGEEERRLVSIIELWKCQRLKSFLLPGFCRQSQQSAVEPFSAKLYLVSSSFFHLC